MIRSTPGDVLQRADVATLAPDDAALHLVGGQGHERDGRLGRVAGREALHAGGQDVPAAARGVTACLLFDLAHDAGLLVAGLLLHLLQQQLARLRAADARQPLELVDPPCGDLRGLRLEPLHRALALGEGPLALRDLREAGLERLLALQDALLQPDDLRRALDGVGGRSERGLTGRPGSCGRAQPGAARPRRGCLHAGARPDALGGRSRGLGVGLSAQRPGGDCRQACRGCCNSKLHGHVSSGGRKADEYPRRRVESGCRRALSFSRVMAKQPVARLRETERRGAACRLSRPAGSTRLVRHRGRAGPRARSGWAAEPSAFHGERQKPFQ
jgi:hypothetical protein